MPAPHTPPESRDSARGLERPRWSRAQWIAAGVYFFVMVGILWFWLERLNSIAVRTIPCAGAVPRCISLRLGARQHDVRSRAALAAPGGPLDAVDCRASRDARPQGGITGS